MRALFAIAFVPALLAGSLAPWAARGPAGWELSAKSRPGAMAGALLLAMLFVWLAEQVQPETPGWNARPLSDGGRGWSRLGVDLVYLFGVAQLSALLIGAVDPLLRPAAAALRLGSLGPPWPAQAPFPARVALAFLALELFAYWIHRAAHRFAILWRFHGTHHRISELNGLKAVRTHPLDNAISYAGRMVPLFWLGAGLEELLAANYLGGILGILAHANVRIADGGLSLLLNLPRCHAVHHSSDRAEAGSNFGCHTVLWDRVFRTFRSAPAPGLVLGADPPGPRSLWQELAWPLYRREG